MTKFRKKPVVIEAFQVGELPPKWFAESGCVILCKTDPHTPYRIKTLEGDMLANFGDWIVKGVKNELYPVRDDIFKETYDPVGEL